MNITPVTRCYRKYWEGGTRESIRWAVSKTPSTLYQSTAQKHEFVHDINQTRSGLHDPVHTVIDIDVALTGRRRFRRNCCETAESKRSTGTKIKTPPQISSPAGQVLPVAYVQEQNLTTKHVVGNHEGLEFLQVSQLIGNGTCCPSYA